MSTILARYQVRQQRSLALASGEALRAVAHEAIRQLGPGVAVLLARTDDALLLCGAIAAQRSERTDVRLAPVGREDWTAPEGAVLVEFEPTSGMRASLEDAMPGTPILSLALRPQAASARVAA